MKTKSFKIGTVDFKCYKYDYKSVKDFVKEFNIKNYDVLCYTKPNGKLTSKFTFKFGKFGTIDLTSCTWLVISSDDIVYVLKDSEVDNLDIFTETIAWIDNEIRENTKNYKKDKDKLNSSISSEINKLIGDKPKTDNSLFNYSTTTTQVLDKTINDELLKANKTINDLKKKLKEFEIQTKIQENELKFYRDYIKMH